MFVPYSSDIFCISLISVYKSVKINRHFWGFMIHPMDRSVIFLKSIRLKMPVFQNPCNKRPFTGFSTHGFPTIRQHWISDHNFYVEKYTIFQPFDNPPFSTKSLRSGTVWERVGMISYWNTTLMNIVKNRTFHTFFHHFSNVFYTHFNGCCVTRESHSYDTPGLLASYSHIHIQIIWTRELSEPLWITFREVQRVLWSKKSESEYEYLLLTTLGSYDIRGKKKRLEDS